MYTQELNKSASTLNITDDDDDGGGGDVYDDDFANHFSF